MDFGGLHGFQHLPNVTLSSLNFSKTGLKDSFKKWGMNDDLKVQFYSFTKPFKPYLQDEFIKDFFGCPAVTSTLEVKSCSTLGFKLLGIPASRITFNNVPCTQTTMQLFDKILENGEIIRNSETGRIVQCLPQYFRPPLNDNPDSDSDGDTHFAGNSEEIEVADNLRKFILSIKYPNAFDNDEEPFEPGDTLTTEEASEFLFQLFTHFIIGGTLSQYEDNVNPYLQAVKVFYKDLMAVTKEGGNGDGDQGVKIKVMSHVFKIRSVSNTDPEYCQFEGKKAENLLFSKGHMNNFLYIIVNPEKQICTTVYYHV